MGNFKKSAGISTNTSTFILIFNIKFSGCPNSLGAKLHINREKLPIYLFLCTVSTTTSLGIPVVMSSDGSL